MWQDSQEKPSTSASGYIIRCVAYGFGETLVIIKQYLGVVIF